MVNTGHCHPRVIAAAQAQLTHFSHTCFQVVAYDGYLRLFDPKTGQDLDKVSLGGNIESSPAVYGDMAVVGSYAQKLFGVRIR